MAPSPSGLLGLRIDVDTYEGLRDGVPRLLDTLRAKRARGTFYVAMGPDRSGLAILNLLRPGFLAKMRRTGAVRAYGLRTVLSGTLLPSRRIGAGLPDILGRIRDEGHELGVHAWDHRSWQDRLLGWDRERIASELDRGRAAYQAALGEPPRTYAAPAWLTADAALVHQEGYALQYASDCRGSEPFLPVVGGVRLTTPQVPATLPTLDEALGFSHASADSFFSSVLERAAAQPWPVLTIHAELEGGPYAPDFSSFLERSAAGSVVPLGTLLAARLARGSLEPCPLSHAGVPGRHGVVSVQGSGARSTAAGGSLGTDSHGIERPNTNPCP